MRLAKSGRAGGRLAGLENGLVGAAEHGDEEVEEDDGDEEEVGHRHRRDQHLLRRGGDESAPPMDKSRQCPIYNS